MQPHEILRWWLSMAKVFKTTYMFHGIVKLRFPCRSLSGKTFWISKQKNEIANVFKMFSVILNREPLLPGMQAFGRLWICWSLRTDTMCSIHHSHQHPQQCALNFCRTEPLPVRNDTEGIRIWTIDLLDVWIQICNVLICSQWPIFLLEAWGHVPLVLKRNVARNFKSTKKHSCQNPWENQWFPQMPQAWKTFGSHSISTRLEITLGPHTLSSVDRFSIWSCVMLPSPSAMKLAWDKQLVKGIVLFFLKRRFNKEVRFFSSGWGWKTKLPK